VSVLIACKNAPSRYGDRDNDHDIQRLAYRGNSVIAGSEVGDADALRYRPMGWRMYRPKQARSEVLWWNPVHWAARKKECIQISSKDAPAPRFIVSVLLEHYETAVLRRFGAIHLVAFKTSSKAHAREYRRQVEEITKWMAKHPRGVLLGDFNGEPHGDWLAPLMTVAQAHTPDTKTGPHNDMIDMIVTNLEIAHARDAKALPGFHGDHKPLEATLPLRKG
jgi:endonuclease/exonuclease/phosphatase family metal-dependent hydrolase